MVSPFSISIVSAKLIQPIQWKVFQRKVPISVFLAVQAMANIIIILQMDVWRISHKAIYLFMQQLLDEQIRDPVIRCQPRLHREL